MKNMKIEINDEQTLDEVLDELERLGYTQVESVRKAKFIVTYESCCFVLSCFTKSEHKLTTLAELKEMK